MRPGLGGWQHRRLEHVTAKRQKGRDTTGHGGVYPREPMTDPVRLRRETGDDRHAVVSVEPGTAAGTGLVRVARGASATSLSGGTVYGPYPLVGIQEAFDLAVAELESEGFSIVVPGWDLLNDLDSPDAGRRGRAAVRLGWRRRPADVPKLLDVARAALDQRRSDAMPLVDALGLVGDAKAIPIAREMAEKKNLAWRRSGVEALRNLGDDEGLAAARERALERLSPGIASALAAEDEESTKGAAALLASVSAEDPRKAGLFADVLYELGTPLAVSSARTILGGAQLGRPHLWRYAKSILKRAMLRRDAETFGLLAHFVDVAGGPGEVATVKSGLDGKKQSMRIFGIKTQGYMRRACARHLRDLARWEPHRYAHHAAATLVRYEPKDARTPKGRRGGFAHCLVLGRILFENDPRYELRGDRWVASGHKLVGPRPEAYPKLWDAGRESYFLVLAHAKLPMVFAFGIAALDRDPELLRTATNRQLVRLTHANPELASGTSLFARVASELDRRFDPSKPALDLMVALAARRLPLELREMLLRWIASSAPSWSRQDEAVFQLPLAVDTEVRRSVVNAMIAALRADASLRVEMAPGFLAILRGPETEPGRHAAFAIIAREALLEELAGALDLDALLAWIDSGDPSGKSVAGALLGARGDGIEVLGRDRVVAMCEDEVRAVRAAGQAVVLGALPKLRDDPSILFALAESAWDDTRDLAFRLLRDEIDLVALGLEGLVGLCDSNDPEVQALGRDLVVRHFDELDAEEVLHRLSEHPSREMRRFALGLMHVHVRDGFVPLARLEGYFRAVLFDTWPSRPLKYGTLAFLLERGLRDEGQARFVADVLQSVLRTQTRGDFERIIQALARLQLRFPEIETPLSVLGVPSTAVGPA